MIIAKGKMFSEFGGNCIIEFEHEFRSLSSLQHFLSYNDGDIKEISITGTIKERN